MHAWHPQVPVAISRRRRLLLRAVEAGNWPTMLAHARARCVAFSEDLVGSGRCAFADGKGRVSGPRHRKIGGAWPQLKRRGNIF